jgi:phosphate transport system substrate-binding protein
MFYLEKFPALTALLLSVALLGGCGSVATDSKAEAEADTALTGTVATGGSTSMQKLMGMLQEDFMDKNASVSVTYEPTGSGAGISGASGGALDIGLSSRGLREDEEDVETVTVCLDGVAIVVNAENPVTDLTVEELAKIFTGEIDNWSEVGGQAAPIVPIGREAGSGTRDAFEAILDVADRCAYAQELTATGAVTAAVAANENAIGYASLSAVGENVRVLTVNGAACTEENILSGAYPVQRPFNFVVHKDATPSAAAEAFLTYAIDGSADAWIRAAGCIPVSGQ